MRPIEEQLLEKYLRIKGDLPGRKPHRTRRIGEKLRRSSAKNQVETVNVWLSHGKKKTQEKKEE